jgi:hypothetical protein
MQFNPSSYVLRKKDDGTTFEDEMSENLFSSEGNPTGKIYVLKGPVGSGKTWCTNYICERILPFKLKNSICINVDTWKIFNKGESEFNTLERVFRDAAERAIVSSLFKKKMQYYSAIMNYIGGPSKSKIELMQMAPFLQPKDIIEFLLSLQKVSHLLIVIDNIDENSAQAIETGSRFAWELATFFRKIKVKKPRTILMPVRDYTANYFSDQNKFAFVNLPRLDEIILINKKLGQTRRLISKEAKGIIHEVPWFGYKEKGKMYVPQSRIYKISKEYTYALLQYFTKYIFSRHEPQLVSMLRDLSAENVRVMVRNVYNIFHSTKLPLFPLFDRAFSPEVALLKEHEPALFELNIAIECLMAIHYPFYDVDTSAIMNLFRALPSGTPMDYKNTLIISRILCFLSNVGKTTYGKLVRDFNKAGYELDYVKAGLGKCLHHGIIRSGHGRTVEDFDPQNTEIEPLPAVKYYLEKLIFEPSYLQYVCEDTWMPKKLCVPISQKYNTLISYGDRKKRMEGVRKLIQFVKEQEQRERRHLVNVLKCDEETFLDQMSIKWRHRGSWIYQVLEKEVLPIIIRKDGIEC